MDTFKDEIQKDAAICSNCFRRLFEPEEINFIVQKDGWPKPVRDSLDGVLLPHREFLPGIDSVPHPKTGVGMTRTCKCGTLRHSTTMRPVSSSALISLGCRVVERMDEKDFQLNEDTFFDKVRELKSNPDEQHKDDSILAKAVEEAVQEPKHSDNDGPPGLRLSGPTRP